MTAARKARRAARTKADRKTESAARSTEAARLLHFAILDRVTVDELSEFVDRLPARARALLAWSVSSGEWKTANAILLGLGLTGEDR